MFLFWVEMVDLILNIDGKYRSYMYWIFINKIPTFFSYSEKKEEKEKKKFIYSDKLLFYKYNLQYIT